MQQSAICSAIGFAAIHKVLITKTKPSRTSPKKLHAKGGTSPTRVTLGSPAGWERRDGVLAGKSKEREKQQSHGSHKKLWQRSE